MAKFFGKIGYYNNTVEETITENGVEIGTGVWVDEIIEKDYYGDVLKQSRNWEPSTDQTNDNLSVSNRISIVADDFAYVNFPTMRYIIWGGVYWKIASVEIQRPRIILNIGGVYNGTKASPPEDPS
jgi:hypothetical protein